MYDWDPEKSNGNQEKHGISFPEARDYIFEGPNLLVTNVAYEKEEQRHAVVGKFRGYYYTGIFTVRNFRIRIISVRRARNEEKKFAQKAGI
jgi:uncharacterized DUF497 family protein